MHLLSLAVFIVYAISATLSDRTFRLTNQCDQTIWFGIQGQPLIYSGSVVVEAGSSQDINVPDGWVSGRFWARTGCQWTNGEFVCATGDCGATVNGFGVQCDGIGGQPPATLIEFTLNGAADLDYYDLSLVDGENLNVMVQPIAGQYTLVNNPSLGQYNCGTASCIFNASLCPPELQMDDGAGNLICASICAAIFNTQQRAEFPYLQTIYNNPDTRSLVCCSCDGNHCVSPTDNVTPGGKCYVDQWPLSTQGTRYDQVFKSQCPDAYSWAFDDAVSSYQCFNGNYEIITCPSGPSTANAPNPTMTTSDATVTQPSQNNVCNGAGFDPNAYWCDDGCLCPTGEYACGTNPYACYQPSMYSCVNGQLQPV